MPGAVSTPALALGIDVGGTFVDFVLARGSDLTLHKELRGGELSDAVLRGLEHLAATQGLTRGEFLRQVGRIVHGTTVTTNAVITNSGARVGLLTTHGVRDALEMRRGLKEEVYDQKYQAPDPLIPRWRRFGIPGRLDQRGEEVTPLDLTEVHRADRQLGAEGVEAMAICFMHSYLNQEHEEAAADAVRADLPGTFLSVSSRLAPQLGFYERLSTTVLDAYVGPLLNRYLRSLVQSLEAEGFAGTLLIVTSAGGVASADVARSRPVETIGSGPAAGPSAAVPFARAQEYEDCVVVDMGGTSFDSSVLHGGRPLTVRRGSVERRTVAVSMVDLHSVGAGGGSVIWLDAAGVLRVGPESAGANPGPACYRRGGRRPTCTDADLFLGYLNPDHFLGGQLRLDRKAAEDAFRRELGDLGARPLEAAAGAFAVVNANMSAGLRVVTLERGIDPRSLPMVVAGGAGPVHAAAIAQEMGVSTVLVPAAAATFCALGTLFLDYRHELVRGQLAQLDSAQQQVRPLLKQMAAQARRLLRDEGVPPANQRIDYATDLRYPRQFREITVPLTEQEVRDWDVEAIQARFHQAHLRLHGYETPGWSVELVNVRVSAVGRIPGPELPHLARQSGAARPVAERLAYDVEAGSLQPTAVYDGEKLTFGQRLKGPALIELPSTTIVVPRQYRVVVDRLGTFTLFTPDVEDDVLRRVGL
jgi:N-methylhydantoinase A